MTGFLQQVMITVLLGGLLWPVCLAYGPRAGDELSPTVVLGLYPLASLALALRLPTRAGMSFVAAVVGFIVYQIPLATVGWLEELQKGPAWEIALAFGGIVVVTGLLAEGANLLARRLNGLAREWLFTWVFLFVGALCGVIGARDITNDFLGPFLRMPDVFYYFVAGLIIGGGYAIGLLIDSFVLLTTLSGNELVVTDKTTQSADHRWSTISKWWRAQSIWIYATALIVSAVTGVVCDVFWAFEGVVLTVSCLVILPIYTIADSLFHPSILWCPLRAASLPVVQGVVIFQMMGFLDQLYISVAVAVAAASLSFAISSIVAVRTKKQRK